MKVIFLDRDGVINKDPGGWTEHSYVTRWSDFHFLPGAKDAVRKLTEAGYEIIIVSNQAGIDRGYFSMDTLKEITDNMLREIFSHGGKINSVHYCPHKPEEECGCRKPATGLFKKAAEKIGINFKECFFIGDGSTDIAAGKKIGCRTILLLSGKSNLEDVKDWEHKPDFIKKDLLEAVNWILNDKHITEGREDV